MARDREPLDTSTFHSETVYIRSRPYFNSTFLQRAPFISRGPQSLRFSRRPIRVNFSPYMS